MALTEHQQTSLLQLTQAMFNATPGTIYLDSLGSRLTAGKSLAELAQSLAGNALFFGKNYASDLTPKAFADAFINDLVGNNASADNKTLAANYVASRVTAGATQGEVIAEITGILSAFPASNPGWGNAALAYNTGNAKKIVDNLVGDTVTAKDKAGAVDYILTQMAAGQTFGAMVEWAITTLGGVDHINPVWGNAAALFDNRIEVSQYYSIDKTGSATDLTTLQHILTGVTADVATVTTAKAAIDDLLNHSGTIDLAHLNGSNGFRLDGILTSDKTGFSVSGAGDINNDGFDDVIVSMPHSYDDSYSGASAVVFGKATGFSATLALSSLDGSNGFRLNGVTGGEAAGLSVSSAGDVNGDGFDDLIIGAPLSDVIGHDAGFSYVVFGKASGFSAVLELSSLNGSNGFRLSPPTNSLTGWSVSGAGDVNGDGFDDVIIGAPYAAPNGSKSGSSYVVFGRASGFSATLDLSSLNGSNGFRVDGVAAENQAGISVNAGDVNGDGFDDLLIGAYYADPNDAAGSGSSYVIFGKASGFDATLDLSSLNGANGFRIDGVTAGDASGYSISGAGDVNGDGFDDVIIGAPDADPNGSNSGTSYVVFGKASGFGATLALSSLDGSNGFRLEGVAAGDYSGKSVSNAGDFNGDGFDDLIVGSYAADANGVGSGASYLIFGKASGFSASLNLSNLSIVDGFSLAGLTSVDGLGRSVSNAGDVNKDGLDDLIIGAPFADGSTFNSGAAYVIFGTRFASASASLTTSALDSPDIHDHSAAAPLIGVNVATDIM